jgi:hypothetical protein
LYTRLGESQSRSGHIRKTSLPPGFDPRAVQTVEGIYTGYAIQGHITREEIIGKYVHGRRHVLIKGNIPRSSSAD